MTDMQRNWEAESQFWQIKYFELLTHTGQVIGMLARGPMSEAIDAQSSDLAAQMMSALRAKAQEAQAQAEQGAQGDSSESPEQPPQSGWGTA